MKTWMMAGAGVVMLAAGGVAMAQGTSNAPNNGSQPPMAVEKGPGQNAPGSNGPGQNGPGQNGPGQNGPGGEAAENGPGGMHHGWHHHPGWGPREAEMGRMMRMHMHPPPPPPPPSKAAHFRFRKGDAVVDIKCADDESMKACVDAGSTLLDKLASEQAQHQRQQQQHEQQ